MGSSSPGHREEPSYVHTQYSFQQSHHRLCHVHYHIDTYSRCSLKGQRGRASSLAHVDLLGLRALLTLELAAPEHLAVADPLHPPLLHVVAPPAADGVAAAVLAADPPARPGGVAAPPAEAWRLLDVGQLTASQGRHVGVVESVAAPVSYPLGQMRLARGLVGVREGLHRLLVLVLENVADGMEGGQLQPAGLDSARARHAVTLARGVHLVLHHLTNT